MKYELQQQPAVNGVTQGPGIDPALIEQMVAEASQLKADGERKMSVSEELFAQLQGAMQNFYSQKQQIDQEDMAKVGQQMQGGGMQQMGAIAGRTMFELGLGKRFFTQYKSRGAIRRRTKVKKITKRIPDRAKDPEGWKNKAFDYGKRKKVAAMGPNYTLGAIAGRTMFELGRRK